MNKHVKRCVGFTHDPATFPSEEMELIRARATARFEGGLAMELLAHARKEVNPA